MKNGKGWCIVQLTQSNRQPEGGVNITPLSVDEMISRLLALFSVPAEQTAVDTENRTDLQEDADQLRQVEKYAALSLMKLGIPVHVQGYALLRQAVVYATLRPEALANLGRDLYPAVAERQGVPAGTVERSIRHAIQLTWNRKGPAAFSKLPGNGGYDAGEKPANREFLALLSERIRLKLME